MWKRAVAKFTSEHMGMVVTKEIFASVFREAFDEVARVPTIVNAFHNAGIFPVNFSAIRHSKLSPSNLYCDVQSSKSSPPRSTISCQHFEELLRSGTRRKFESRYDEGYNVEDDEFYGIWKKMKELSLSKGTETVEQEDSSASEKLPVQQHEVRERSVLVVYPKPKALKPKKAQFQTKILNR